MGRIFCFELVDYRYVLVHLHIVPLVRILKMKLIHDAIVLAAKAHNGQEYGKLPYIHHLFDVVAILYEYGYDDEEMIAAGWLHDVVEDTYTVGFAGIQEQFGDKVELLVHAVSAVGKNRKEKKAYTIRELNDYPKAIPLKMADRLANIRNCAKNNPRLLDMYRKEMPDYAKMFSETNFKMFQEMLSFL